MQLLEPLFVFFIFKPREVGCIEVGKRAAGMGEVVSKLSANRNLHPLDCIHNQETKLPVESVTGPNDLKCRAGAEGVVCLAERVKVAAQAVIVN